MVLSTEGRTVSLSPVQREDNGTLTGPLLASCETAFGCDTQPDFDAIVVVSFLLINCRFVSTVILVLASLPRRSKPI